MVLDLKLRLKVFQTAAGKHRGREFLEKIVRAQNAGSHIA